MLNRSQVEHWPGRSLIGRDGMSIGTIRAVFADPAGHPAWATIRVGGRLSRRVRFVPIADADQVAAGIAVPFTAPQVAAAPDADRNGDLTARERRALHAHYGLREDATLPPARASSDDGSDAGTTPGPSRSTRAGEDDGPTGTSATPPRFPASTGPADLEELPTFHPDGPAVGDPSDPRGGDPREDPVFPTDPPDAGD
jgi:hypothetical protein